VNFRVTAISGFLLIVAFLAFTSIGGEISLLTQQENFVDQYNSPWTDNGTLYNLEETAQGDLTIADTGTTVTQYPTNSSYDRANGAYIGERQIYEGTVNIDRLETVLDGINTETKANAYINYYSSGNLIQQEEVVLSNGFISFPDVGTEQSNVTSYSVDLFLQTNTNTDNIEVESVETNGTNFLNLVNPELSGLIQLVMFVILVGMAILYQAKSTGTA
jgi:hypothetical protein